MDTGDVTTLANPDIVEQIRQAVQGKGVVRTKAGPERHQALRRRAVISIPRRTHLEGTSVTLTEED